eukprot:2917-Pleurochrysis_carterae.AAC.8
MANTLGVGQNAEVRKLPVQVVSEHIARTRWWFQKRALNGHTVINPGLRLSARTVNRAPPRASRWWCLRLHRRRSASRRSWPLAAARAAAGAELGDLIPSGHDVCELIGGGAQVDRGQGGAGGGRVGGEADADEEGDAVRCIVALVHRRRQSQRVREGMERLNARDGLEQLHEPAQSRLDPAAEVEMLCRRVGSHAHRHKRGIHTEKVDPLEDRLEGGGGRRARQDGRRARQLALDHAERARAHAMRGAQARLARRDDGHDHRTRPLARRRPV